MVCKIYNVWYDAVTFIISVSLVRFIVYGLQENRKILSMVISQHAFLYEMSFGRHMERGDAYGPPTPIPVAWSLRPATEFYHKINYTTNTTITTTTVFKFWERGESLSSKKGEEKKRESEKKR